MIFITLSMIKNNNKGSQVKTSQTIRKKYRKMRQDKDKVKKTG